MDKFVINGGKPLKGSVHISGAKNAAVAILPAVLLADSPCVIENLPEISDVSTLLRAIKQLGAEVRAINKSTVEINPVPANSFFGHSVLPGQYARQYCSEGRKYPQLVYPSALDRCFVHGSAFNCKLGNAYLSA